MWQKHRQPSGQEFISKQWLGLSNALTHGAKLVLSFFKVERKCQGPKRSIKITDHFMSISANVIYCITCTYCKKLYIGETGRRQVTDSENTFAT